MITHVHRDPVIVTWTDAGWTTRPDGTSQGGHVVMMADADLLAGKESHMTLLSWHSGKLSRVARSSSSAETQTAADGDDESVYVRLCMSELLFGEINIKHWQDYVRRIPAALVLDCRGVYDALARSASSYLGLKDKKSGLEALAFKPSLHMCGTALRWIHSAAQLGDMMTKDSDVARGPWSLLVQRGHRWKLVHDPTFESARKRAKRGADVLEDSSMQDEEQIPKDSQALV